MDAMYLLPDKKGREKRKSGCNGCSLSSPPPVACVFDKATKIKTDSDKTMPAPSARRVA